MGQKKNLSPDCGTKLTAEEEIIFKIKTEELKNQIKELKAPAATYTIPVVFHILTNPGVSESQMKCRVDDAIQLMNDDFNGLNSDFNSVDPLFDGIKSTIDINFCAATLDPDGNAMQYPGMEWKINEGITYGYAPGINNHNWWGVNGKYYLDVLVVSFPNNNNGDETQSGHAFLPTQSTIPHITYNYRYIGRTCGSWADDGFGSVMSHEVGHYLGLRHAWGTTYNWGDTRNCSDDDGISDTPNTIGLEGCGDNQTSYCGNKYNAENYMDYNTGCYAMFTQEQTDVMTGWLDDVSSATHPRGRLWQSTNLVATGCSQTFAPIANFSASPTIIIEGGSVDFTDLTAGNPTSWSWTFLGGTPSSSTSQSPTVTYDTPGLYTVTLVATNSLGNDDEVKVDYIEVLPTGTQICDQQENTTAGDSKFQNTITSQWGYVAGHNGYGDLAKVERFPAPSLPQTSITGTDIWFAKADAGSGASTIDVKVWDGAGGTPGAVLATKTIAVNSISTADYTQIDFDSPVAVTDEYFVGVELTYNPGDTVVIWINADGESSPGTAWEKWSDGDWYAYSNTAAWGWNMSHYLRVRYCSGDGSLGIKESTNNSLNVYPNPGTGQFNVSFSSDKADEYVLTVTDVIGKQISTETLKQQEDEYLVNLDLSGFQDGIYFLSIASKSNQFRRTIRLVKAN